MENYIKIGIGVMILNGNKILLGHRAKDKKDTGGIFEVDCWTLPGGKQEYNENFFEGAKREVKEETNLDLDVNDLELFDAADDIQPDRHYITMHIIARTFSGELKVMEPNKEDEWKWFDLDNLPTKLYSPSKKFIETYLKRVHKYNNTDKTFINFLIKAKKSTYANSTIEKVPSSRIGSSDYNYEEIIDNKKYTYHDTYFGGTKFIGEEVVYCDSNKPIWGMNYYGITYDNSLGEEAMDNALRPALMKVGEDKNMIPVRGPIKFENNGYTYTFKTTGTIDNFDGIEQIYKDNNLIYELHCSGGIIK